jgi:hypothetical protein
LSLINDLVCGGSRDEVLGVNCHKQGTRHVSDQGVFGGVDEK